MLLVEQLIVVVGFKSSTEWLPWHVLKRHVVVVAVNAIASLVAGQVAVARRYVVH